MIKGTARYASVRHKIVQPAMQVQAIGLFVPEPDVDLKVSIETGVQIASIYMIHGDKLAELTALAPGMKFGLHSLPAVTTDNGVAMMPK